MRFCERIFQRLKIGKILENVTKTEYKRNCLMVYITKPFKEHLEMTHQNHEQAQIIARLISDRGYNVDVIDYDTKYVFLRKKYDAVFDICVKDRPVYKKHLKDGAKRICYFTGSESEFANNAEKERVKALEKRRGVKLELRRQAPLISKEVEKFDEIIMIGNEYSLATYKGFCLPKTFLVNNTGYDFEDRFDRAMRKPNNFLYFGSTGCVHKGLDLLLEIFSEKNFPCNLYVCGTFESEKDFRDEYEKELFYTDNIISIGFVNIQSEKFAEICNECTFAIFPSCSEGMAGAVATCMSAGLIPICSEICGYGENSEVITLEECSIEHIRKIILEAATMDDKWIEERSRKVLELVKRKYSVEAFEKSMGNALEAVL